MRKRASRRKPRGIMYIGYGRSRTPPSGRVLTPVDKVLALAGLSIGADVTYMEYPNDPSRSEGNRHYLYKRGVGWTDEGVSLTRTEAKYDVINGTSETIGAGQLGKNGRLEPESTNLFDYQNDLENAYWSKTNGGGEATVTNNAAVAPDGTTTAARVQFNANASAQVYKNTAVAPVGPLTLSVWARADTPTTMQLFVYDTVTGSKFKNISVTTQWQRFVFSTTMNGVGYPSLIGNSDATARECFVWGANMVSEAYQTSQIIGAVTRSADALRLTGLSGLTAQGGICVMLRLPYASTVPASDQYHVSLNGSNTTDDGVFVYTKASDDHLYAELRSGGASQGTVDLGTYAADTQYALALGWSSAGLTAAINGVEKTATSAVTVPASIDRLEFGRGISTDTAHGGEIPFALILDRLPTLAERAALSGSSFNSAIWTGL